MMKFISDGLSQAALVTAVATASLFLASFDRIPDHLKRPGMTPLSSRLQPLFEKTTTQCFGRFVIDIPSTATVVYGPAEIEFPIEYHGGKENTIEQRVAEALSKAEKNRDYFMPGEVAKFPLFGKVIDGSIPGHKIVFGSTNQVGYSIASFVPVGDDLFIQRTNGVLPAEDEIKPVIERLNKIASLILPRSAGETPDESGSCFEGGFVASPLQYEKATLGVRLKEFPDVHFSIEVHKNQDRLVESSGLELLLERAERQANLEGLGAIYARIKTIRRGPRKLGNWTGYEIVARKPAYKHDTDAHEFRYHSLGAVNDPMQPELDVRLYTGVKNDRQASVRPSLTDDEAEALWDKLIGSIRIRSTGDSKSSKSDSPLVPLGKLLRTGETCVQTGWWQCSDSASVDGGNRRYITSGELMPHLVLSRKPTLWQKLTGEKSGFKKTIVWQLVDYEDAAIEQEDRARTSALLSGKRDA